MTVVHSVGITRRAMLAALLAVGLGCLGIPAAPAQIQPDALPSWNNGAPKRAITDFVARVTREGGPDYVKPAERIQYHLRATH
jgi:hypothetical protein